MLWTPDTLESCEARQSQHRKSSPTNCSLRWSALEPAVLSSPQPRGSTAPRMTSQGTLAAPNGPNRKQRNSRLIAVWAEELLETENMCDFLPLPSLIMLGLVCATEAFPVKGKELAKLASSSCCVSDHLLDNNGLQPKSATIINSHCWR